MRICKVWDSDYPWDVRAAKVSRSLTAAGHEVHMVARNRARRATREELPEATIHRFRTLPFGKAFNSASTFPAFFNPRWAAAIYRTAQREQADLILVRDLPLAPTAIASGRMLGIPVVLDMAENYPAMMQSLYDNNVQKPFDFLVRNPRAVRMIERWVLEHIDAVLVVVEESRDRLIALGYPADRIAVVCNTPPLERLSTTEQHRHAASRLHINYLGLLEAPRGLGVVIDAVARCVARNVPLHLTVIGSGRERERFERQAAALGLGPDVIKFHGYVQNAEALRLVSQADVGIVPHQATESWNTTIPNKLFDYMAAGLAIITSDAKPAARIVKETGTGEVYHWGSPDELADAIERLQDPALRAACGDRGRAAIRDRYNWEADTARMLAALERAVAGAR